MAETGVLLDRRGEPVGPAIAWHDVRGTDEARAVADEIGRGRFAAQTGLPASPLCSLAKLRWQLAHDPGATGAVRWLGVPEWVARSLGAADVAELSLASRTGMLSLRDREWWPEALAWLGVPDGFLAELVPAGTPVGRVGDALPEARDAVIAVAGHDHVAATVGAGATAEGDVLHSSGTADVFVRSIRGAARAGADRRCRRQRRDRRLACHPGALGAAQRQRAQRRAGDGARVARRRRSGRPRRAQRRRRRAGAERRCAWKASATLVRCRCTASRPA